MVDALLAKAQGYLSEDKLDILVEAYQFAENAHDGQLRKSGEPFVEHPLQTALFLADLHLDSNTLVAALLHDVMEDCDVEFKDLESRFGLEVATLVDGVTKLTRTEFMSEDRSVDLDIQPTDNVDHAATLRKMLMSMAKDIRVVLIKLSDRLHNMRTLKSLPPERRISIAQETLDIYAPLAHRLGIWEMKWRLEDLAFQHLHPDAYRQISRLLNSKRIERESYIQEVCHIVEEELSDNNIQATVTGRPKHIYSIHKKIQRYATEHKQVGEIYDLFALRVLVDSPQDCYTALGIIHSKWHPLPGQFDDYIANPKDDLYQSLHTSVLCKDASPVEIQIRTHEMHHVSEYGVAAHWLYKEGHPSDVRFEEKMTWLRQLLEWQRDVSGAEEFVESFKTDIFKNQVFVYTPKGEIKELPTLSTPLDFAYRIHTEIGHSCVGTRINGKLVPLHTPLNNGDTVQILTSKDVRGPSLDWLNPNLGYIKTASAREKIRQWFNRQERKINVQKGMEILRNQLRRLNVTTEDDVVAKLMDCDDTEQLFAALGNGSVTETQVFNRLSSNKLIPEHGNQSFILDSSPASGVEVLGVGDLLTTMADCCKPVQNNEIVGFITRSRGVSIHRKTCSDILSETDVERLVEVEWGENQTIYPIRIQIRAWDRIGLLGDVTLVISDERVNIASCVSEEYDDVSIISLTVFIKGIDQLSHLFAKLEGVRGVINVFRLEPQAKVAKSNILQDQEMIRSDGKSISTKIK